MPHEDLGGLHGVLLRGTWHAWRELSALVGDSPGHFSIGELSPGDGFLPFRTTGDDGGRHRRRRHVNRAFMSWRFDRPDFLDLKPVSGVARAAQTAITSLLQR